MERQRQRAAERRPGRVVTPESKARWNRTHKFIRFGITEARYNQMLEEQGNACAICGEPFGGRPADLLGPRPLVLPRSG
jgi:hypothetical protein